MCRLLLLFCTELTSVVKHGGTTREIPDYSEPAETEQQRFREQCRGLPAGEVVAGTFPTCCAVSSGQVQ